MPMEFAHQQVMLRAVDRILATCPRAQRKDVAHPTRLMRAPQDVPFVIRKTRRKFQHTLAEVTLWERIS